MSTRPRATRHTARTSLLDAALDVIRRQGLHATSVDQLCEAAGVTKGAFFHHFESKEALAVAAAGHWSHTTGALFASADYHRHEDPFERIKGYLELRAALVQGTAAQYTCLVGTMVQESFATQAEVRAACEASIYGHVSTLEDDFEALIADRGAPEGVTARGLAVHTQTVLQGAFVLAKASDDPGAVLDALAHLGRYLECLFSSIPHQQEAS